MPPIRSLRAALAAVCASVTFATFAAPASAAVTPNGRLQIYHLDVGQGDGALIVTPLGQVVMIDNGVSPSHPTAIGKSVVLQLQALGVTHIDHHFASHYHADHIGNTVAIASAGITIANGWDRGGSYTTATYTNYKNTLGVNRKTLVKNQVITLDSLSAHPVTIKVVDLAGAGASGVSGDENALCLMLKVKYGEFDETFGGDTPGLSPEPLVEPIVATEIGTAEVYKVHHHGSATSSDASILAAIQAQLGVISCGNGNSYGHPTAAALTRLHAANMKTYWTETGSGVAPVAGQDYVASGQVYISATWEPGGVDTIRNINSTGGNTFVHTFFNSGPADGTPPVATITSPDGGESWKVGSTHAITWTATDNVGVSTVDVAYSTNGGTSWTNLATGLSNTGSMLWSVPAPGTSQARLRVRARDAAGNLGSDSSATNVTFDYWQIAASGATGGTISPSGLVDVIEGFSSAFTIAPGSGWGIGNVIVDGVGVGAVANYTFSNVSANHTISPLFTDVAPPVVAVEVPLGGESWAAGSTHDVTWNASDNAGVDSITIAYSSHGVGGPWIRVAGGLPNSGTYAWTLPSISSDSAVVRVTAYDAAHLSGFDISNSLFSISLGTAGVNDGPLAFALASPTPNPSAGNTRLSFTLPREGHARLEVLDLSGRRLWAIEGVFSAGRYSTEWNGRTTDGSTVGAGLYFVRLSTPFGTRTDRLARLR